MNAEQSEPAASSATTERVESAEHHAHSMPSDDTRRRTSTQPLITQREGPAVNGDATGSSGSQVEAPEHPAHVGKTVDTDREETGGKRRR